MTYYSMTIGFLLLAAVLLVAHFIMQAIFDRRNRILYPMVEHYCHFVLGFVYVMVVIFAGTDWGLATRIAAGLLLGIVGGLLMYCIVCQAIMLGVFTISLLRGEKPES